MNLYGTGNVYRQLIQVTLVPLHAGLAIGEDEDFEFDSLSHREPRRGDEFIVTHG